MAYKRVSGAELMKEKEIITVTKWAEREKQKIDKKAREMIVAINRKYQRSTTRQQFEDLKKRSKE